MAVKDLPIGGWLRRFAPRILSQVGDAEPDAGAFGIIKKMILNDDMLTPRQRREGIDIAVQNENSAVTERWTKDADTTWLTKNIRPLSVLLVIASLVIFTWADGTGTFELSKRYFQLWEVAMASVVGGYFGLRSVEKIKRK